MLEPSPSILQHVTVIVDTVFKESLKQNEVIWALIQCDWGLYKKWKTGHRHTQRENRVDTGRMWHLQSRREGPGETHLPEL